MVICSLQGTFTYSGSLVLLDLNAGISGIVVCVRGHAVISEVVLVVGG